MRRCGIHHRYMYTVRMIATEPATRKAIGIKTAASMNR